MRKDSQKKSPIEEKKTTNFCTRKKKALCHGNRK